MEWYHQLRSVLIHEGALGLLIMGLLDASLLPTPGGQDLVVIVLAASHPEWWLYYAVVGTLGSVLGAYVTYRLGRGGGRHALERYIPPRIRERVYGLFARWGIVALFLAAILPPPTPMSPFLLAAGALRHPLPRFLAILTLAKGLRYLLAAYLAAIYGRRALMGLLAHDYVDIVLAALGAAVALGLAIVVWRRARTPLKAPAAAVRRSSRRRSRSPVR